MKLKVAIFAFNGEMMCFMHSMLNAMDMNRKGYDVKLILEGKATSLIGELDKEETPFSNLYKKCKDLGILYGVCKACCQKMGTLEEAKRQDLKILDDMNGHSGMEVFISQGYEIITL